MCSLTAVRLAEPYAVFAASHLANMKLLGKDADLRTLCKQIDNSATMIEHDYSKLTATTGANNQA